MTAAAGEQLSRSSRPRRPGRRRWLRAVWPDPDSDSRFSRNPPRPWPAAPPWAGDTPRALLRRCGQWGNVWTRSRQDGQDWTSVGGRGGVSLRNCPRPCESVRELATQWQLPAPYVWSPQYSRTSLVASPECVSKGSQVKKQQRQNGVANLILTLASCGRTFFDAAPAPSLRRPKGKIHTM
jgi:hypothetical protein